MIVAVASAMESAEAFRPGRDSSHLREDDRQRLSDPRFSIIHPRRYLMVSSQHGSSDELIGGAFLRFT